MLLFPLSSLQLPETDKFSKHQFLVHQVFSVLKVELWGSCYALLPHQVKFLQNTSPLINLLALYFAGYDLGLKRHNLNFAAGNE